MVAGGRQGRLQVRVGDRAPLPGRVLAPLGQRRGARLPGPLDRAASTSARASSTRCPRSTTRPRWPSGSPCSTTSPTAASSSAPAGGPGPTRSWASCPGMTDLTGTREIWEETIGEFPKMWLQDEYEGFDGKYWSLPPRKILPKPLHKPHPAMWYAAGNTSSYDMAAHKGLGVLGFSVGSLDELGPVVEAYKDDDRQRRAGRRLRQRQHHGDHRRLRGRGPRGAPDARRGAPLIPTCRPTSSATTTPSRTRAQVPVLARADPRRDRRGASSCWGGAGIICGDPDDALAAVPALGGGRGRPAGVRGRARPPPRRHARDHPADGRARHPQDRHRPGAPHHPVPRGGGRPRA